MGIAILAVLILPAMGNDARQSRTDDVFVRQLTERRLYDLAESHCREMRNRVTDTDDKARWQLRLAEVYEQHAWLADNASREQLLNQCISELTEFLGDHTVSPGFELRLRFRQVHIIRTSVRIALLLNKAGSLFGLGREANQARLIDRSTIDSANVRNLQQGLEVLTKLSQQLESIRSHIDVAVARDLREEARLLTAELHLLRAATNFSDVPAETANERIKANELLNLILRSTSSPGIRYQCHWLLAELMLTSDSGRDFASKIRVLKSLRTSETDSPPEFLTVQHLLSQQESEKSLEQLSQLSAKTVQQRQVKAWLMMECHLGYRQLADELEDARLITESVKRFEMASQEAVVVTGGVYREAVEAAIRRFELVDTVGLPVADLIEQVERHRSSGNGKEALQLIEVALRRLPPSGADRSRAALLLHAGELHIDLQQWSAAESQLRKAADMFGHNGRTAEQATADLLAVFAYAQLLATGQADSSKQTYLTALRKHINIFPEEATAMTARKWLFQAIQYEQPTEAISILNSMLDKTPDDAEKVVLLEQMGELLRSSLSTSRESSATAYRNAVNRLKQSKVRPDSALAVVDAYILFLDIQATKRPDWQSIGQRVQEIRSSLVARDSVAPTVVAAHEICLLAEAVAQARLRRSADDAQKLRQSLLNLNVERYADVVQFLFSQYRNEQLKVGDQWLAQVSDAMLRRLITHDVPPGVATGWLKIATRNAALTNNFDVQNQITENLSQRSLSLAELSSVAQAMASAADEQSAGSQHNAIGPIATQTNFWRRVLANSEQGSDTWLEASLRLAGYSAAAGQDVAARRQLGVIMTLYPEWGSPDRKTRAQKLLSTLSP